MVCIKFHLQENVYYFVNYLGFPSSLNGKESNYNVEDLGSIHG